MKQNKKYIICGIASLFVMLLGITSLKSGNVFGSGAFPFLILFVLGAWETHVFTRKKDAERSFLRDALPYFLQVLILLSAAVGLGFLFIREIGFSAFIPAISQIICPVLILIIYGLRNLKYRRFIIGGMLIFAVQLVALYYSYLSLFSRSAASFVATLYICVIISAFELKLYERKQHQMREFLRESVPFLVQSGIILVLDICAFCFLCIRAKQTGDEYGTFMMFSALPVFVILLLNTGIVYLIAEVRKKKTEFFVIGGMGMIAAHSGILFAVPENYVQAAATIPLGYPICLVIVIGIGLWETELFHRWPVSVGVFLHEMLPCLLQAVIVLAADAMICGMQYLIGNQIISYAEENWGDVTEAMNDLGIAAGVSVFLGVIVCAVIQVIMLLIVFAVGAGKSTAHRNKKR